MGSIRKLRPSDLTAIVNLSLGLFKQYSGEDLPLDEQLIIKQFQKYLRDTSVYMKGMFVEDKLVGWFLAVPGHATLHSPVQGMSQIYYHSSLTGVKAAKALVEFHEDFFRHVEAMHYEVAITSSILPSWQSFERLLIGAGWRSAGPGRLTRPTKFHRSQRREQRAGRPGAVPMPVRGGAR